MRDILTVAKKELRAYFSDKVIVLQMILLPFAFVFGYAILKSVMMEADTEAKLVIAGAEGSAHFGKFLGNFIPMMVFMAVFMVCMNLSVNSIAGDKENGFLNTLLITPVKRSSIAAGKSVSIFVIAIISSISAFAGMALSLPRLASAIGMEESLAYQGSDYISLLLGVVTAAFVLAVVLLIVSTLSKDVKQATTIAPVFLFIMIIPMLLGSTESFSASIEKIGIVNYLIPVWNSAKLLKDVTRLSYSVPSLVLTCILNLIVAVAGIFVMGRLFEQEKIINQ